MSAPTRILLVDDHAAIRSIIAGFLSFYPEFSVVGEATDGHVLARVEELHPDVVIMDVTMPRMNGIEATRRITSAYPDVKVIGLSMDGADDMADRMRAAGAVSYVPNSASADELVAAVRAACPTSRMESWPAG